MHLSYRSACSTWCVEPCEANYSSIYSSPSHRRYWFGQDTYVSILISSYLEVPLGVMAFLQAVLVCWQHCLSLYLLAFTWLLVTSSGNHSLTFKGLCLAPQRAIQWCMLLLRNPKSSGSKEAVTPVVISCVTSSQNLLNLVIQLFCNCHFFIKQILIECQALF